MKKLKYWGAALIVGLFLGFTFWWTDHKDKKDPHNRSDVFVYQEKGILHWLKLSIQDGKVKGTLHEQKMIEEIGKVPFIEQKNYPLDGEITEKGYEFNVKKDDKVSKIKVTPSSKGLIVQRPEDKESKLYIATNHEKLNEYVKAIKKELQIAIYHSEEKENQRLKNFFSELKSVYGYLYSTKNGPIQLFIKIDEALNEGELTGSLLVMSNAGDNKQYEETRYDLNGITDGLMVQFFTSVDGKKVKLKGDFLEGATSFDLSFWMTDQKLSFHAVTEEEFKHRYNEFKVRAQK